MPRHTSRAPGARPTPAPFPARRTAAVRTVLAGATALVAVLSLSACGLRLETPPPAEPSPDAAEQVRARTVDDALGLAASADAVVSDVTDERVRLVLQDVAAFSRRHAEELGGVYDSGLPRPTPTATPTSPPTATDVADLLADLVTDAGTAAQDADTVPDGGLARLVASVAVARDGLAERLADASGLPLTGPTDDGTTADGASPQAADGAAPAAADAPADATPTDGTPAPDPQGAAAVALAHDEAAWTLTVLAARTTGDERDALLASAARHRADSDTWATLAGVAGRTTDPRRSAYALPAGVDDPAVRQALPRTLEQAVADASALAVAGSPAGARADAVASLRSATRAAVALGAAPVPFPGMPELAGAPAGPTS